MLKPIRTITWKLKTKYLAKSNVIDKIHWKVKTKTTTKSPSELNFVFHETSRESNSRKKRRKIAQFVRLLTNALVQIVLLFGKIFFLKIVSKWLRQSHHSWISNLIFWCKKFCRGKILGLNGISILNFESLGIF